MIWIIILTSVTVSLDSLICGLSLSMSGINKKNLIIGIAVTVLIMCLVASICGTILSQILSEQVAGCGGIILVIIGVINLFKRDTEIKSNKTAFKEVVATGFAVGLDGAFATLSLAVMGMNALYIPFIIAFFHALLIYLGTILGEKPKRLKISIIAPFILIGLGIYKIVSAFI